MKKGKIISGLLCLTLMFSLMGCDKVSLSKNKEQNIENENILEKQSTTFKVVEDTMIPNFLITKYSKEDEILHDYKLFKTILLNLEDESITQEEKDTFSQKYGFDKLQGEINPIDLYNCSPDFYEGFSTYFIMFTTPTNVLDNLLKDAQLQIQNYLQDTLTTTENSDYVLASDFKELNPKENIKKYLSDNKIEITKVIYPENCKFFKSQTAGGLVVTVDVGIEGTIKGKTFKETIPYDFYFVTSDDERHGKSNIGSTKRFEIMGVTSSCFNNEDNTYDFSKILK